MLGVLSCPLVPSPTPDLCPVAAALFAFPSTLAGSLLMALGPVTHPGLPVACSSDPSPTPPACHILVSLPPCPQVPHGIQVSDASLAWICLPLTCPFGLSAKSQHKLFSASKSAWPLGVPPSPGDSGISSEVNWTEEQWAGCWIVREKHNHDECPTSSQTYNTRLIF